jgi:predicted amidohydrolase YtcJ
MTGANSRGGVAALAIRDGRIVALGTDTELEHLAGPGTEVVDLAGKSVLPGFVDAHVHLMQTGLSIMGPDLGHCSSADEVIDEIASMVRASARDEPLLLHRCRLVSLHGSLSIGELDDVAPDNPLAVGDVDLQSCLVNSKAWELVGLSTKTPGVELQSDTGQPTGLLTGRAYVSTRRHFQTLMGASKRLEALRVASQAAVEVGITTVHAIEGREAFGDSDVHLLLGLRDQLPVRTVVYYQTTEVSKVIDLEVSGVADVWVDGSYANHTAALLDPYADDPTSRGLLYFGQEQLDQFVWRAHREGLQVGLHAIGDAAIEQALGAYDRVVGKQSDHTRRHRIEHFSLPTDRQLENAARLGLVVVMQPVLAMAGRERLVEILGPERAKRRHPYREIIDAGIVVAGSSDSDFTPMGPLSAIHSLLNHPDEQRRLTPFEAVTLFTLNGAWATCEEGCKGAIQPGRLADLVVLGEDPLTAAPHTVEDIPVEMTIVGGKVVFRGGLP